MDIKSINKQIEFYEQLKQILSREPANDTEAVFLKYIELRRTADVAAYMNKLGLRVTGPKKERLYINTDITAILDDEAAVELVDPVIYDLVKQMQHSGRLLQRHVLNNMRQ